MDTFLRWFLPLYLLIYVAAAFVVRSLLVWRRTGINPYRLGDADNAHDFIGRLFRLAFVVVGVMIGCYFVGDAFYTYLLPIQWLQAPPLVMVGLALLVGSLVWIVIAQAQMGSSWRIGIDHDHATQLVQRGVFKLSRNPIFLGMRLTLLGFFLVLPNAVSLVVLVLGEALMQIQVRLEEAHLAQLHGAAYDMYRQHTRRWL
jgi:protein-S-isoprenylcysteine O-methyltransferase Ste14